MNKQLIALFIMVLSLNSPVLFGSDLAKEKRWADQIVDGLIVGDAVWLQASGNKFLGIYAEHESEKLKGAAIILHGLGVHPNWPDVIQPLRAELPSYGWATLSLQMPILGNDADYEAYSPLFPEIAPRLKAGITHLKQQGYENIVIIGHSFGAAMGAYFLANNPTGDIQALVAIGISGTQFDAPDKNYYSSLQKLSLPILDIFGSIDIQPVLDSEKERLRVARKAGVKNYRQIKVTGANHFFHGLEADLVRHVKSWLSKYSGKQVMDKTDK